MPSRRMIDPSFWQSETVAALSIARRYFFIGIFSNADDQGRLKAHPALLRSRLYPFDDIPLDEIREALAELAEGGFIVLYTVEGKDYLQIPNWWTYQRPRWARTSDHPPPEGWTDRVRYRQGNTVIKDNWNDARDEATPESEEDEVTEVPAPCHRETTVAPPRDNDGSTVGPAPRDRGRDRDRDRGGDSDSISISAPPRAPPLVVDVAPDQLDAIADILATFGMGQSQTVARESRLMLEEVERILTWARDLAQRDAIEDKFGFVRWALREGERAPPDNGDDESWRRFVSGDYAEYVEP